MIRSLLAAFAITALLVPSASAKDEAAKDSSKSADAKAAKKKELKTIDQALSAARKGDKLAFIQMGREGCGNCQALKKAIHSGSYELPEEEFVWIEVNCDDPKVNADFDRRFKVKGDMLPFVAIANGKGKLLASSSGYVSKEKFADLLSKAHAASGKKAGDAKPADAKDGAKGETKKSESK